MIIDQQLIQFAIKLKDKGLDKFLANKPDLILTNVRAFKHLPKVEINRNATALKVRPAELTRW
jgi:hypothetical protein